jgi:flavoprotein
MTDINTTIDDTAREILQKIDEAWPSPIVLRKDIAKFSCGLVTVKTMGSLDYIGKGIRYTLINGKVAYAKQDVLDWLISKTNNKKTKEKIRGAPRRGKNDILLQN